MIDALRHARRLRQCALRSLKLADHSPTREVARHYRLISQHYAALARLAESGKYPDLSPEPSPIEGSLPDTPPDSLSGPTHLSTHGATAPSHDERSSANHCPSPPQVEAR
jgi:hypothetical protein